MENLLKRLERKSVVWYLLFFLFFFFVLRLPSLIEPAWYGDEGVYQVIGLAIDHGRQLYTQIWDNKPPLLYITYALLHSDQFSIRFLSLLFGIFSLVSIFLLSRRLFTTNLATIVTTLFFTIFFATPVLEGNIANAENFMLCPILLGAYLIYKNSTSKNSQHKKNVTLFISGFLLGIAFLFKIVALFDFVAFLFFLFFEYTREIKFDTLSKYITYRLSFFTTIKEYMLGFFLPIAITILYFYLNGRLSDFITATFLGNVSYVGYHNVLFIPQGLLIVKFTLLALFLMFLFSQRKFLPQPILFILIWLGFSVFNALFSQRPYLHYLLVALSSLSLFLGLLFDLKSSPLRTRLSYLFIIVFVALFAVIHPYTFPKFFSYYQNALKFLTNNESVNQYRDFFDNKTSRDYMISTFITKHTAQNDAVFIWGDSAQIYALSNKLPPGRYTVAYHILQNKNGIRDTQLALTLVNPKYIITLPENGTLPFSIQSYVPTRILRGATIYEKTY